MKHLIFLSLALLTCANSVTAAENPSGTCGKNCNWSFDTTSGTLTVNGSMVDFGTPEGVPWKNQMANIKSANILGGTIGSFAFSGAISLESVYMPNVYHIEDSAFVNTTSLTSVDMPNVSELKGRAFINADSLEYIGFNPEKLTTVRENAFDGNEADIWYSCDKSTGSCGTCAEYLKVGMGCVSDCGSGYLGKEGRCIDADLGCGAEYSESYGYCYRVRYTLPEADKATSNDNENMIEWIFE